MQMDEDATTGLRKLSFLLSQNPFPTPPETFGTSTMTYNLLLLLISVLFLKFVLCFIGWLVLSSLLSAWKCFRDV